MLVHLELNGVTMPDHYKLLKVEAPDTISQRLLEERILPSDWRRHESHTRSIGDEWLAEGVTALFRVPSAIVPETFNVLLNPLHSDAKLVKILWHREYPWDRRLFS